MLRLVYKLAVSHGDDTVSVCVISLRCDQTLSSDVDGDFLDLVRSRKFTESLLCSLSSFSCSLKFSDEIFAVSLDFYA